MCLLFALFALCVMFMCFLGDFQRQASGGEVEMARGQRGGGRGGGVGFRGD